MGGDGGLVLLLLGSRGLLREEEGEGEGEEEGRKREREREGEEEGEGGRREKEREGEGGGELRHSTTTNCIHSISWNNIRHDNQ